VITGKESPKVDLRPRPPNVCDPAAVNSLIGGRPRRLMLIPIEEPNDTCKFSLCADTLCRHRIVEAWWSLLAPFSVSHPPRKRVSRATSSAAAEIHPLRTTTSKAGHFFR
jgi:hypothetical protein